ncbi:MAG: helix-turn-helix transcriptional regulator [Clostridiaceae bacterium]|nr:helix-turn-helix transcriptional regulator [Clostridiaceae bacterium]
MEYINIFRIDQAERLLKNTDMNITEVSLAIGFSDSNYFSRIFKKYKNVPPSEKNKEGFRMKDQKNLFSILSYIFQALHSSSTVETFHIHMYKYSYYQVFFHKRV